MKEAKENSIFWVLMLVGVLAIYSKVKEINEKQHNIYIKQSRR